MIWRPSRPTRVVQDVPLPYDGPDGILVGCRDLVALRELGKWRRLVQTSLPRVSLHTVLIAASWEPKVKRAAEAAFAPSELPSIAFVADPDGRWVPPLDGEVVFAAVVQGGVAACLVLGGPTDEAWDRIEAEVR